MKDLLGEVGVLFSYPKNLILLAVRWILAYGFAMPALLKLNDMSETAKWFDTMSIPFPILTAYLVSGIEALGIVLLILGLFTRYITVLLSFIMLGAMFYVHGSHGFSVADNGVEIPLYYLLFLMNLASFGAGKYSLDRAIFKDGSNE
ncbi:DoxX family protein [Sulfurovum sp.]|uniref:DoxX family protein n=1 Tax=Sulfurovum sp. TaxID=1969726 RepID=UPI002867CDE2|nr:DoxX family protein [Sulfurovum sp.]